MNGPGGAGLIFLVGMPGAGKTTTGFRLARALHAGFLDLDAAIALRTGMTIPAIFETQGEAGFRQIETTVLHELTGARPLVVATGGGTPCFNNNIVFMRQQGMVVWLDPPLAVVAARLWQAQSNRPLLRHAQTFEALRTYLKDLYIQRLPFYRQAHFRFDPQEFSPAAIAAVVHSA